MAGLTRAGLPVRAGDRCTIVGIVSSLWGLGPTSGVAVKLTSGGLISVQTNDLVNSQKSTLSSLVQVEDSFTRPNELLINKPWWVDVTSEGGQIVSGGAACLAFGNLVGVDSWKSTVFGSNLFVQAQILALPAPSSGDLNVAVTIVSNPLTSPAVNGYTFGVDTGDFLNTNYTLSTPGPVSRVTGAAGKVGDIIRLQKNGAVLTASVNGVAIGTYTDPSPLSGNLLPGFVLAEFSGTGLPLLGSFKAGSLDLLDTNTHTNYRGSPVFVGDDVSVMGLVTAVSGVGTTAVLTVQLQESGYSVFVQGIDVYATQSL